MALHHFADQFHHQNGLADPGAAEHRRLAAAGQRGQQVDHLDAGFHQVAARTAARERRRRAVDRRARGAGRQFRPVVARQPHDVEQPAQHRVAHRGGQRAAGGADRCAALQARRALQCDGPRGSGVEMALHLRHQPFRAVPQDLHRIEQRRRIARHLPPPIELPREGAQPAHPPVRGRHHEQRGQGREQSLAVPGERIPRERQHHAAEGEAHHDDGNHPVAVFRPLRDGEIPGQRGLITDRRERDEK